MGPLALIPMDKNYRLVCKIIVFLTLPIWSQTEVGDMVLPDIDEYILDNGMRVLISPNYDYPTIYCHLYINSGTLDNPIDKPGLAENTFWELDEGTVKYSKKGQVKEKLYSLGDNDGWFRDKYIDDTHGVIASYFLKEDAREGIQLLSEVIRNPTLPQRGAFWKNLTVRMVPKETYYDRGDLAALHMKNLYADLIENVNPKNAMHFTKKALKIWHQSFLRPENTTLMVTGDFNYLYIKKLVEEYFGDWESTLPMPDRRNYTITLNDNTGIKVRFVNIPDEIDAEIRIITYGPSAIDSWGYAAELARITLGWSRGSRLGKINTRFNEYGRLSYGSSGSPRLPYTYIYGNAKYTKLYSVYNAIIEEFDKMSQNSITELELVSAKQTAINFIKNESNNPEVFTKFIQRRYNRNGYSLAEIRSNFKHFKKVTIDEVNEAAARMFDPDNFMMVVLGNRDSCTTFLEQFEDVEYYEQTEELRASANSR